MIIIPIKWLFHWEILGRSPLRVPVSARGMITGNRSVFGEFVPPQVLRCFKWLKKKTHIPIGSMYGIYIYIYANMWGILMVNVTIHGSYGIYSLMRYISYQFIAPIHPTTIKPSKIGVICTNFATPKTGAPPFQNSHFAMRKIICKWWWFSCNCNSAFLHQLSYGYPLAI